MDPIFYECQDPKGFNTDNFGGKRIRNYGYRLIWWFDRIRKMIRNRCFATKPEAQTALDQWVELGYGMYVQGDKEQFVPIENKAQ
jgi:hypothetical protein